jgi:hypothetical protein
MLYYLAFQFVKEHVIRDINIHRIIRYVIRYVAHVR